MRLKEKITKALENGMIVYEGTNVKFASGHIIGGVLVDSKGELIKIIERCLYREDFSIPEFLQ